MTVSSTRSCRRPDLRARAFAAAARVHAARACPRTRRASTSKGGRSRSPKTTTISRPNSTSTSRRRSKRPSTKACRFTFVLEFELIRPRWYWTRTSRVVSLQQEYRLSYNALTRQYRLGVGESPPEFRHTRRSARSDEPRAAAVRQPAPARSDATRRTSRAMRHGLDTSQLPKPFQLTRRPSREWNVGSDWYRWTVAL